MKEGLALIAAMSKAIFSQLLTTCLRKTVRKRQAPKIAHSGMAFAHCLPSVAWSRHFCRRRLCLRM